MAHNPVGIGFTLITGGSSTASAAFSVQTDALRIVAVTKDCHVAIGTNPTANHTNYFVVSGEPEALSLTPKSQPVVGLTTGTSTTLHFSEGTGCVFNVGDTVTVTGLTPSSLNFTHKPVERILTNASSQPGFFSTRAVITHDSSSSTVSGASTATFNGGHVRNSLKIAALTDGGAGSINCHQIQVAGG